MIQIHDQKITINGQDTILFGGELHYFRVPKKDWKARIRSIKEAGGNLVSTYIPWMFHEQEEGDIDLNGRTFPEKDIQHFLDLIKEEGMYCLVRPGPYVMAEIIDHGVPHWFIDRYPEGCAHKQDGRLHDTRIASYMSPIFLEKVDIWYRTICELLSPYQVQNGGPIVLFQLDNEIGMLNWVTNQIDFNDATLDAFIPYFCAYYSDEDLKDTYGITKDEAAAFVREELLHPTKQYGMQMQQVSGHFHRHFYRMYVAQLKELANSYGIDLPFVINVHGFHTEDLVKRGTMYPIGLSQLMDTGEVEGTMFAGDYYLGNIEYDNYIDIILANAFTRAVQPVNQPLFSAEFQGGCIFDRPRLQPKTFDLTTRLCVAAGMDAINYYMFVGGENYQGIGIFGRRHDWQTPVALDGTLRPHYATIQHIGKMLQLYGSKLANAKPQYDTTLGFYPDYYMTEYHNEFTEALVKRLKQSREINLNSGFIKFLVHHNVVVDAYNMLKKEDIDVERTPTLWMFATEWMASDVQSKLESYVKRGGKLVIFPELPSKGIDDKLCTILRDALDIRVKNTYKNDLVRMAEMDSIFANEVQTYDEQDGAFAWYEGTDETVAFEKKLGEGRVYVFGMTLSGDFEYQKDVIGLVMKQVGFTSDIQLDTELDASVRMAEDGGMFVFLHNFDGYSKHTKVRFRGQLLFNGATLEVSPNSGLMLPINIALSDELTICSSSAELTGLDANDTELILSIAPTKGPSVLEVQMRTIIPQPQKSVNILALGNGRFKITLDETNAAINLRFA
ncbi:beta-galactosidase [Paenibacillus sp. FSL R10-2734]|uniref:beta-galactosidase n=1 Tax=Paenibacillus sp. FSL R10-2734 TaxID=2954691 RepID=UPI0030DA0FF9